MPKLIPTRTRIADLGKPRVVVIGGGFGGLEVVKGLRQAKVQTVLFDKYNHHCFQPLLYQVATSALETSSIVVPFRRNFKKFRDFYFRLGEVTQIKPDENCIETSIGSVHYDYLVIANGAGTNFYGMKDVEEHAFPMKTITDSIKLRNCIIRNFENALLVDDPTVMNSLIDFVVVGGGPTGVELAGALAELKLHVFPNDYKELDIKDMDIHLIEASDRLLNGMSSVASTKSKEYLEKLGVQVHLNVAVKSYDGTTITLSNGNTLSSRMMIWAAGITAQPIGGIPAEAFGRGRRIKVDAFNRVPGYSNIFAVGDACIMDADSAFQSGHPQMAQPAMQQGKLVARNIQRQLENKPMKPFKYFDKGSMATIGRNKAVADLKGVKVQGFFAWLIWMFIHLFSLVGFKNKFFVFLSWIFSYFSYDKSNRLIIARPKDGVH